MAAARFNDPIEPMDLANMHKNGVRSLAVQCHRCLHEVIMNVDHLPDDVTVPSLGPKMVCTKCGGRIVAGVEGARKVETTRRHAHQRTSYALVIFGVGRTRSSVGVQGRGFGVP